MSDEQILILNFSLILTTSIRQILFLNNFFSLKFYFFRLFCFRQFLLDSNLRVILATFQPRRQNISWSPSTEFKTRSTLYVVNFCRLFYLLLVPIGLDTNPVFDILKRRLKSPSIQYCSVNNGFKMYIFNQRICTSDLLYMNLN